eukprot:CAMPEP_0195321526 /NCGR_PEP_ID=MMETSP0708-20121125/6764_1 /TAXON_ID=33640 /ORGANISM="Asterionellopsis glacialis, Strain CCMP134" /LENGTH=60 /DNA_ID=CAMNT_0040388169 /DNA_START=655 /DNA_END=837 /DNA_ORIENTATION=-
MGTHESVKPAAIINDGYRTSHLYVLCPKIPPAMTPSAFPAPKDSKTPVASSFVNPRSSFK